MTNTDNFNIGFNGETGKQEIPFTSAEETSCDEGVQNAYEVI